MAFIMVVCLLRATKADLDENISCTILAGKSIRCGDLGRKQGLPLLCILRGHAGFAQDRFAFLASKSSTYAADFLLLTQSVLSLNDENPVSFDNFLLY